MEIATYLQGLPPLLAGETGADGWQARRNALLALLEKEEYGPLPAGAWEERPVLIPGRETLLPGGETLLREFVCEASLGGRAQRFALLAYTAVGQTGRRPVVLGLSAFGNLLWDPMLEKAEKFFPAPLLVKRGYTALLARVDDVTPEGWQAALYPDGKRTAGELALWAWAASMARRAAAGVPGADGGQVWVTGCSRAGKAALWAAAKDDTFLGAATNVSGCGGAAITRRKTGERVAEITRQFPLWFTPSYAQWAGREEQMPFDQHMLLALLAPCPLYIASASLDEWADPAAEYAACVAASPAWALHGLPGVAGNGEVPPAEAPLQTGHIWHHIRKGEHGLELYDWQQYIEFFGHFGKQTPQKVVIP